MKKSLKAALFSAFVFPGAGQLVVQQKKKGALIMGLTAIYLTFSFLAAMELSEKLGELILSGKLSLNAASISRTVNDLRLESNYQYLDAASYVILLLWIYSIISAYQAGKKIDEMDHEKT